MRRLFRSELLKLWKSPVWLLVLFSPALSTLIAIVEPAPSEPWLSTFMTMVSIHGLLFLPLLTGVFSAMLCRYEHVGGGWKQLLALPVARGKVYAVKFMLVMVLLAVTQLLLLGCLLGIGWASGFSDPIPWKMLLLALFGGWIACLPLAALQMGVSVAWASFAAPLAVNVIFTIPNILIVNSEDYGPYYPWAQPMLAMVPGQSEGYSFGAFENMDTFWYVVGASFVLFFVAGWQYFVRKPI